MAATRKCIEEIKLLQKIEKFYEDIKLGQSGVPHLNFALLIERWVDDYGSLIRRLSMDETISFNALEAYYLKNFPHSTGGPCLQAYRRAGKTYGKVKHA